MHGGWHREWRYLYDDRGSCRRVTLVILDRDLQQRVSCTEQLGPFSSMVEATELLEERANALAMEQIPGQLSLLDD